MMVSLDFVRCLLFHHCAICNEYPDQIVVVTFVKGR
jgi:hypothetical protein